MSLPATIRAEVKVTTSDTVQLGRRELDALGSSDPSSVGILATLFWPGKHGTGGRWVVVDGVESFKKVSAASISVGLQALARAERQQSALADLRAHVDTVWPRLLGAFLDDALASHEQLTARLRQCHESGSLRDQLPAHEVLDHDHRNALNAIFENLGEAEAGRVLQDLFAYLLGLAGYRSITVNAIGVPDLVATDLEPSGAQERSVTVVVTLPEALRVARWCKETGDEELAGKVVAAVKKSESMD